MSTDATDTDEKPDLELLAEVVRRRHRLFCPGCLTHLADLHLGGETNVQEYAADCPGCDAALREYAILSYAPGRSPTQAPGTVRSQVQRRWREWIGVGATTDAPFRATDRGEADDDHDDAGPRRVIGMTDALARAFDEAADELGWRFDPDAGRTSLEGGDGR